jgi:hypothetical protein
MFPYVDGVRRAWVAALLLASAGACSRGTVHRAVLPTTTAPAPTTTVAPATTTSTTVDPGSLPQTTDKPSATDPAFLARMQALWQAVQTGDAGAGLPAFFPLSAYLQVKAISDPAADWHDRLVALYDKDIAAVHASLGAGAAGARLVGVSVPEAAATWVLPGAEYNKGSYWRVYGTELTYTEGGHPASFEIVSLISRRGQWYVVHFRTPPS